MKVTVSCIVPLADAEALDELVSKFERASRHVVSVACLRAGIKSLTREPDKVLDLVQDQRAGKHIRLREAH